MRIAKYIANSGHCSRRDAEKLIIKQKVFLNNKVCLKPNINVSQNDKIIIDGKILTLDKKIKLWKFYKPVKSICTNKDPQKRKTIFEIISKNMPRLISIGRLDFMSEGLMLLTNNGDFARKLELPSSNILRVYRICISSKIIKEDIKKINQGIKINKIVYKKINVKIEKIINEKTWLIFRLYEGKNREIRNICSFFNWKIIKLIRLQFGPIKLRKEKPGEIEEINIIPKDFL